MASLYNWKETSQSDLPVTSNTEKLFFRKGNTSTYQTLQYDTSPPAHSVFAIYQYGIPLVAGGDFMPTSQNEQTPPTNHENLENLNSCVATGFTRCLEELFL